MLALLSAIENGQIRGDITCVISDCSSAQGVAIAKKRGLNIAVIDVDKSSFEAALINRIKQEKPDLIALAGFMRILSPAFIKQFEGCIMNIHPSLLPAYKGLNTHQRVLKAKEKKHGCSVHFATSKLDGGPLIIQQEVEVKPDDTPDTLAARVLEKEHIIYPKAVSLFCEGRLKQEGENCLLNGRVLKHPLKLN